MVITVVCAHNFTVNARQSVIVPQNVDLCTALLLLAEVSVIFTLRPMMLLAPNRVMVVAGRVLTTVCTLLVLDIPVPTTTFSLLVGIPFGTSTDFGSSYS